MKTVKTFSIDIDLVKKLEHVARVRVTSQSAIVEAALRLYFDHN
jgi:predicted transcriptional regulator